MKLIALALAFIALSLASANATHRYHHHWRHHSSMGARYNPNGTAGGPTTLSATGSSQFSGSSPGRVLSYAWPAQPPCANDAKTSTATLDPHRAF